jgi:tight adherence protein B
MNIGAVEASVLVSVAVFVTIVGLYNLFQAVQSREQIVTRAENLGADPDVLSDPLRRSSFLVRWADRYDRSPKAAGDREFLRRTYLSIKPSEYRMFRIGLAAGLFYITWIILQFSPVIAGVIGLAVFFFGPKLLLFFRRDAYVKAFNSQLVEIAQSLANALKAGMSVQQAVAQVAERLPDPARGEFKQTHHELLLGDNLAQALNAMRRRVRSRDLDILVSAVVVQHSAGGNLARALTAMANTLSERQRMAREVDSLMAESRYSAFVIMVIPFVLIMMIKNTPLGEGLVSTWIGWAALAIFTIIQIGIFFLIQKVARIDV